MKQTFLACCTTVLLATSFSKAHAQADRFAYAITDLTKDGSSWNVLRKLDLQTGAYSDVLFDGTNEKTTRFSALSNKAIAPKEDPEYGTALQAPFSTGVAAAAFDRQHNRLYFAPMFIDQLRYIDLSTMKLYSIDQPFTGAGNMHNDEAKVVTRMAIAPDGTGYAITNDGSAVVRFTTDANPTITQLGALTDDAANGDISIHVRETSFGGDMIADNAGNLFILSAFNHVFKVSTKTRTATHLGSISGLPEDFTVNGAVVNAEGLLLVSSAVDASGYFVVNPANWKAAPYALSTAVYRSSDLANSNFLSVTATQATAETTAPKASTAAVQIYPNPVTGSRFTLLFSKLPAGDYMFDLSDVSGKSLQQIRVALTGAQQTQNVVLPVGTARGVYLAKVTDRSKQTVFEQKVVVQ